ncbi:hypothetical protein ACJMK2_002447 [Sinanodonta woodiana]|uniref:Uncharacterized protein n=1 Tax=Sinanodonta woodiana TaxID=1069815 RepID=A0ABD3XYK5_SINWO
MLTDTQHTSRRNQKLYHTHPYNGSPSEGKGSTKCDKAEGQLTEAYGNFPRLSKTDNNIAYTKRTNPNRENPHCSSSTGNNAKEISPGI